MCTNKSRLSIRFWLRVSSVADQINFRIAKAVPVVGIILRVLVFTALWSSWSKRFVSIAYHTSRQFRKVRRFDQVPALRGFPTALAGRISATIRRIGPKGAVRKQSKVVTNFHYTFFLYCNLRRSYYLITNTQLPFCVLNHITLLIFNLYIIYKNICNVLSPRNQHSKRRMPFEN